MIKHSYVTLLNYFFFNPMIALNIPIIPPTKLITATPRVLAVTALIIISIKILFFVLLKVPLIKQGLQK